MIDSEYNPNDDLQVVGDFFQIDSGASDSSAFFNMDPINRNVLTKPKEKEREINLGGISPQLFTGAKVTSSPIVTPQASAANNKAASCNGKCNSCMWSFLCTSAMKGLTKSSLVPKIG